MLFHKLPYLAVGWCKQEVLEIGQAQEIHFFLV